MAANLKEASNRGSASDTISICNRKRGRPSRSYFGAKKRDALHKSLPDLAPYLFLR